MLELLGPELFERNRTYIEGALAGHPQHFERDLRRKLQGDLRHTQASYIPDVKEGIVNGFFVLVTDVTERKRAEMAAVDAEKRAIAASKIKSQFLANMSHEIRTPLNGVIGMLQLAHDCPGSWEQKEYLEAARQSAEHLLTVIEDVLDIAKIEAGQLKLSSGPILLPTTIEHTIASLSILARQKGLEVATDFSPQLPETVRGDSVRFRQVVLNLFSNAVKFTEKGAITLSAFMDGDLFHLAVSDTGIGIPPEMHSVIFEEFRQCEQDFNRSAGGSGLGLAISRHLARAMGGELWLENGPGQGSTFHFTARLEKMENPVDSGKQKAAAREVPPSAQKILLAEDDPVSILAAKRMLERLNCEVQVARNGKEAVQMAASESFDLILMDLQMPSMDGFEAASAIRRCGTAGSFVPIVALTSNVTVTDRDNCRKAGMDHFLAKPIRIEQLADLLRSFGDDSALAGRARAEAEGPARG